jgi:translation initiation factor IF-2
MIWSLGDPAQVNERSSRSTWKVRHRDGFCWNLESILAKGIRVNQLAKDMGVPSKLILEKLRDEGLGEKAPNHMSVLPLGLAESVREWFTPGQGGTAVETAAPVEVATKPARPRTRKKKVEAPEEPAEAIVQTPEPEIAAPEPQAPPAPVEPAPAAPLPPVEAKPAVVAAPTPPEPVAEIIETPPAVPAAEAPAAKPAAPAPAPPAPPKAAPPSRPTVTLADRPADGGTKVERRPLPPPPAPRMVTPKPAQISGPRVVREEAPDVVPAPRPRRPMGATGSGSSAFTPARPQGGRGVRVVEDDEETTKKKAAGKGSGRSLSARRRGPDGRRGEAMEKLKEYTEADLIERRDRLASASAHRTAFDSHLKKAERGPHVQARSVVERGEPVVIAEPVTVKNLAAALGVKSNEIISKLLRQGQFVTVNQALAPDVAEMAALEFGIELRIQQEKTLDEQLQERYVEFQSKDEDLRPRPPVVTILGHVDHGKTSLLDKIRHSNIAAGEAGGITQHTAAWMVDVGEGDSRKRVTFIDTPGHQAFTSMRARGANMTDVVVLVVSAAEGIQPQTVESINHARAADVPIIVAMNKIDRPDANPDMVLGQLAAQDLNPVEWGGQTEVIRTSAVTGQGVPELIEILDYQSQLLDLKADPTSPARGVVIESRRDEGLGPVATVLVQNGTLKVGDMLLAGPGYGRIRSLWNDRGVSIPEAGPSTPVIVSGLDELPGAGDKFYVVGSVEEARAIAEERQDLTRHRQLSGRNQLTSENIFDTMKAVETKTINLIIKADVAGSRETLVATVTNQNTQEVKVRVIHSGVGPVTESDVELAMATKAKPTDNRVAIIGFHVTADEAARSLAERHHIDVKTYRVIYEIFDDLKKSLSGMLAPEVREKLHGHVEIRQVFKVSRLGNIAGCFVTDGHIQRGSKIRLIRNGVIVTEDLSIESLKRLKDDVREVKNGMECGIKLAGYDDIKVGDVMEAYIRETVERTL